MKKNGSEKLLIQRYLRKNNTGIPFHLKEGDVYSKGNFGLWLVNSSGNQVGFCENNNLPIIPCLMASSLLGRNIRENDKLTFQRHDSLDLKLDSFKNHLISLPKSCSVVFENLYQLFDNCLKGHDLFLYRTWGDFSKFKGIYNNGTIITFTSVPPNDSYIRTLDLQLIEG